MYGHHHHIFIYMYKYIMFKLHISYSYMGALLKINLPIIHVMSFKEESGRFCFHFREVFEKCIDYIGKFLIHFREILNFCYKVVHLEENFHLISWSLPDDEGGITCMTH